MEPSDGNKYLNIPVPIESYRLVQRHFKRASSEYSDIDKVAQAVIGKFILVDVSQELGTLMVAQISDLTTTVRKDKQGDPSITYNIVYDGVGIVDPSSPSNYMIPLDPSDWKKMQNRSKSYGTLKEIEANLLPTITSRISELEHNGEKIRTRKLSLMEAFLLETGYLIQDLKGMLSKGTPAF